jgi:hypothetical protein
MTDRDHFAAAALTGLVGECGYNSPEDVAGEAYALADAMLSAREKDKGGCSSKLDLEADRKSVTSQRCRDTGGQPSESAPTTSLLAEIAARKKAWEAFGSHAWGFGAAANILALERRVAALERFSGAGKSAGEESDSPGEGWRWVEPHEPLERGDQCWSNEGRGWLPVTYYGDEWQITRQFFYRRRIKSHANHDAAPAARATTDASPLRHDQGVTVGMGTGNQTAPPCVETDRASSCKCVPPAAATQRVGSDEGRPLDAGAPTRDHAAGGRGRDTQEPVAWAVMLAGGERIYDVYAIEEDAKAIDEAVTGNHGIVPLYRQPALTAEECEAIELATYEFLYHQDPGGRAQWIREQLLGLLART